jgi:plastocyanin
MMTHRFHSLCLLAGLAFAPVAAGCSRSVTAGPKPQEETAMEIRKVLETKAESSGDESESADAGASGWAALKGKFVVEGAAPPQGPPLAIAKANADCSKHAVFDEGVVVKGDALIGAVIFARTPKLPVKDDAQPSGEVVLDNSQCRFEPHVVFVQAGQKLAVKNSDPFGHNTKIESIANAPQNFTLPSGSVVDQVFAKEESLPVKVGCSIHPWMGAWVLVRDNPYGAVSGSTGEFEIANLPAGKEIEFQLWQEKAMFLKSAKSDDVKVDGKGRFKLTLEPDETKTLVFTIPADSLK